MQEEEKKKANSRWTEKSRADPIRQQEENRQPLELISMIGFVNSLISNSIMLG